MEVGVRIEDPVLVEKLSRILQLQLHDNVNAREMRADGSYQKVKPAPGEPIVNGQMGMYELLKDDWGKLHQPRRSPPLRKHRISKHTRSLCARHRKLCLHRLNHRGKKLQLRPQSQ